MVSKLDYGEVKVAISFRGLFSIADLYDKRMVTSNCLDYVKH
jgi:hypothetical protein